MRRLVIGLLATVVAACALPPASAAPYVGQYYYAEARSNLVGADGKAYQVTLEVTRASAVTSRKVDGAVITWAECAVSCRVLSRHHFDATANIADDRSSANVTSQVGTTRIGLELSAIEERVSGSFSGLRLTESPPGVGPELREWKDAGGKLLVGGLRCRTVPYAEIGYVVAADTIGPEQRNADFGAVIPRGLLQGRGRAKCAEVVQ